MTSTEKSEILKDGLQRVSDAAKFLGVSRSHIYSLMEQGELPYVKLGKSRRVPKQAVLNLAAGHLVISDRA